MKNLPLLIGTLLLTLALVFGVVLMFSKNSTSSLEPVDQAQLLTANPHVRGPQTASITIVEFSDFQCPACRMTETVVDQVLAAYPEQAKLVYRHFPLYQIHPNAQLAAQAAEAAGEENKFWEYHDLLFEHQATWSALENKTEYLEQLAVYAEELGIDKVTFLERIDSDQIKLLVSEDLTAGTKLNIQATPTLYVNGQQVSAPQLMQTVESLINN